MERKCWVAHTREIVDSDVLRPTITELSESREREESSFYTFASPDTILDSGSDQMRADD